MHKDMSLETAYGLIEALVGERQIPGAVARVLWHGEVVGETCSGLAHTAPVIPMNTETIFDLASLTKVVATVSAVVLLVQDGRLDLNEPVGKYVAGFLGDGRERVGIHHLLSHTAGLPATRAYADLGLSGREAVLADISSTSLGPIGGPIVYSDLGFILLGWVAEAAAGQPLDRFLAERVCRPLRMHHTCYNPPISWQQCCAATEFRPHLGHHQWGAVHDRNAGLLGGVSGHAGLFSTIDDLSQWVGAFFWPTSDGVFQPETVRRALRPLAQHGEHGRAWGWIINGSSPAALADMMSPRSVGHTGFTGTGIWFDPSGDWAAILLTNRVHFGRQETASSIAKLRRGFLNAVAEALT